jgi:2-oxoglutarate dehydrogenase E1 component
MRVANCTTAAQFFHLLRRQAALLVKDPLPLIVLTPKSLLRHPFVASAPKDLAEGRWMKVIDDADAASRAADVRRVIFCTGKVAVDLLTSPHRAANPQVAICRVEQLYPLPINEIHATIESYRNAEEIVWVQEEPENMGAWEFVRPSLEGLAGARRMAVLARPRSSSPSEGSAARHAQTQEGLVARAFDTQKDARQAAKRQTAKTNK